MRRENLYEQSVRNRVVGLLEVDEAGEERELRLVRAVGKLSKGEDLRLR